MQPQEEKKIRGVITVPNAVVGLVIAAIYVILTLLIPSQVRVVKNALTDARMYPYIVFIGAAVLAVAFAIAFHKDSYKFDLGIWPMVLGSVMLYVGALTLGFYSSTAIVIVYMMLMWKNRCWWKILLTAVLTPAFIYVAFTLCMNIYLPTGVLI